MTLNTTRAREQLAKGDFRELFIEELGWDRHNAILKVTVDGSTLNLRALAQKRGMVAYQCPTPPGQRLPDYSQRRKIEHQVAKSAHEHLIIFTDATSEIQVWQWVKREPGKPAACREHTFHRSQPGDALLQKLGVIAFTLEEEDRLSLPDVTRRARAGFDVERVTKRFYDHFQKEHAEFLKFITGITGSADREWYASVMLNRLMFVYFIQRKGFLDGDQDYLRNRLTRMRAEHGKNKFYSFYRYFLLRLFHEGLGGKVRTQELETLVGRIPYLNGGLFDVHELEKSDCYGKTVQIPDKAFERIFDYFDQYQWHLDERPLRADNEINPDVLGCIFEKYINQKQMGAYYTKEDITEYISKNTVLPFLFDTARAECKVAFENAKGPTVWDLLRDDPDRYVYKSVRHGVTWTYRPDYAVQGEPLEMPHELPGDIALGLNPPTLHQPVSEGPVKTLDLRKSWNKRAPATHALPTETWREVIERRTRYEEIKTKLAGGDVRDINDLVTLNLDIRQFAQDAIENCEGPDLLRAFWHAIEKVTILDPTCGSGAFLFAALNILEPLYEACLDRMEAFVEDLARSGEERRPEKFSDFRKVLERVAGHPNRRYFIFKSIILNNLFGVDIMKEAVEICKLRLFLKLAAQVEPDANRDNLGIEPLPDIDFNIRAGNTLVGYATLDAVKQAVASKLDFGNTAETIAVKAADLQQAFDAFRSRQVEGDGSVPAEDKQELHRHLKALDDELNRHLASEYGVEPSKKQVFATWLKSHQPFHWFVEFYGIMDRGGFDVIIGNPPYVEISKLRDYSIRHLRTVACGNLYCPMLERFAALGTRFFRTGVIIPLSLSCTERMQEMRTVLESRLGSTWISHYSGDANPSKLFEGVKLRLNILLGVGGSSFSLRSSRYLKWFADGRSTLFTGITYAEVPRRLWYLQLFPKLGTELGRSAFTKLLSRSPLMRFVSKSGMTIYVHRVITMFVKCFDFVPHFSNATDGAKKSEDYKPYLFSSTERADLASAVLNSSTFFFYFIALGDCFHCGKEFVLQFPVDLDDAHKRCGKEMALIGQRLMCDLKKNAVRRRAVSEMTGAVEYDEFWPSKSKTIIDEIDMVLAHHYGFTEEELDCIISYDAKYRMGRGVEVREE